MPVATFGYGSATYESTFFTDPPVLRYVAPVPVALPVAADAERLAGTTYDPSLDLPAYGLPAPSHPQASWEGLADITGDGRPDMLFQHNGKLWVGLNRPDEGGIYTLGQGANIGKVNTGSFADGPMDVSQTLFQRYADSRDGNLEEIWRMSVDTNGDGRLDVIDAAEDPDNWIIYLNTPGNNAAGIKWERTELATYPIRAELEAHGHELFLDHVPLSRKVTGRSWQESGCWFPVNGWVFIPGESPPQCPWTYEFNQGPEQTFVEWQVADFNGDGYFDFIYGTDPVRWEHQDAPVANSTDNHRTHYFGRTDPYTNPGATAGEIRALLNVAGVRFDGGPIFSAPIVLGYSWEGFGKWEQGDGTSSYPAVQTEITGFVDVNGDGLLDWHWKENVYLGDGTRITSQRVILPGAAARLAEGHGQSHETQRSCGRVARDLRS